MSNLKHRLNKIASQGEYSQQLLDKLENVISTISDIETFVKENEDNLYNEDIDTEFVAKELSRISDEIYSNINTKI